MELSAVTEEDDCYVSWENTRCGLEGLLPIFDMDQRLTHSCCIDFLDTPSVKCDFSHRSQDGPIYLGAYDFRLGEGFPHTQVKEMFIFCNALIAGELQSSATLDPGTRASVCVTKLHTAKPPAIDCAPVARSIWQAPLQDSQGTSDSKVQFLHKEDFYG